MMVVMVVMVVGGAGCKPLGGLMVSMSGPELVCGSGWPFFDAGCKPLGGLMVSMSGPELVCGSGWPFFD